MYQQPNFVRRTIMTPGPVEAHPSVLRQMGQPILGQFDPEFLQIMDEVREMIKSTFCHKRINKPLPLMARHVQAWKRGYCVD